MYKEYNNLWILKVGRVLHVISPTPPFMTLIPMHITISNILLCKVEVKVEEEE